MGPTTGGPIDDTSVGGGEDAGDGVSRQPTGPHPQSHRPRRRLVHPQVAAGRDLVEHRLPVHRWVGVGRPGRKLCVWRMIAETFAWRAASATACSTSVRSRSGAIATRALTMTSAWLIFAFDGKESSTAPSRLTKLATP